MKTRHANAQEAAKHRQIELVCWHRATEIELSYTGGSRDRLPTHCAWSRAVPNPPELPNGDERLGYKGSQADLANLSSLRGRIRLQNRISSLRWRSRPEPCICTDVRQRRPIIEAAPISPPSRVRGLVRWTSCGSPYAPVICDEPGPRAARWPPSNDDWRRRSPVVLLLLSHQDLTANKATQVGQWGGQDDSGQALLPGH